MGYKKVFPDPGNRLAEAKRNKRNGNEPQTKSVIVQFSEEPADFLELDDLGSDSSNTTCPSTMSSLVCDGSRQ
jgi:hypothetical protein